MEIRTPVFKSIPLDEDMARTLMEAMVVADREKQLAVDARETPAKRLVRVIRAVYPKVVKPYADLEWVKNA